MEITTLQIVLVFIVACIAGMESVLDEFQFHRPLIACIPVRLRTSPKTTITARFVSRKSAIRIIIFF